jgi:dolichyl-phosphate beta-glucosyltransferase
MFLDRENGGKKVFPFIDYDDIGDASKASIYLSVIVPAYNEEKRLPVMMDEALEYLEMRQAKDKKFTYEIIIVDDGSNDKTTQVGLDYVDKFGSNKVRVLTLEKNRGKGGAVRLGVLSSRGELVLFADADGATRFSDLSKLESTINEQKDDKTIVIGSRAHLEEDAIASRSAIRTFLMHGFHFLVWFFTVRTVRDTQCGFKLFKRPTANLLFHWIHVERWAFDVELLHLAERLKFPIKEVSVFWTEIDGSKIVPVFSWLQMGRDVLKISLLYAIGAWAMPLQKKEN